MKKISYILLSFVIVIILAVIIIIINKPRNAMEVIDNNGVEKNIGNNNEQAYKVTTYVTEKMRDNAEVINPYIICYAYSFTPEYLKSESDNICIIRVISLDSFKHVEDGRDYTHGKILVNNALYGDFKEGEVVDFVRLGGYVESSKFKEHYKGNYESEYLNIVPEDSITIEEGRTYLAYLKYNTVLEKYEIFGIKWGLRELDVPQEKEFVSKIDIDFNTVGLLNNETNSYVNLKKYIDKNI